MSGYDHHEPEKYQQRQNENSDRSTDNPGHPDNVPEELPHDETAAKQRIAEALKVTTASDEDRDQPVQLLRPDPVDHVNLQVVESGLAYLSRVQGPVAVVAVVGKFHTGKSFLLNQLMGKQQGFGVGPTVQPETMGVWMWGKVRQPTSVSRIVCIGNPDWVSHVCVAYRIQRWPWLRYLTLTYSRMSWFFVLRKIGNKTKKRMKEEEIEKGDCGPPTRKVFFVILSDLNQAIPNHLWLFDSRLRGD